jgi:hypothetical protein
MQLVLVFTFSMIVPIFWSPMFVPTEGERAAASWIMAAAAGGFILLMLPHWGPKRYAMHEPNWPWGLAVVIGGMVATLLEGHAPVAGALVVGLLTIGLMRAWVVGVARPMNVPSAVGVVLAIGQMAYLAALAFARDKAIVAPLAIAPLVVCMISMIALARQRVRDAASDPR